jgi:hypothetical protein
MYTMVRRIGRSRKGSAPADPRQVKFSIWPILEPGIGRIDRIGPRIGRSRAVFYLKKK